MRLIFAAALLVAAANSIQLATSAAIHVADIVETQETADHDNNLVPPVP